MSINIHIYSLDHKVGFEGEKVGLIPALGFQRCGIAELHHVLALN